MGNTLTLDLIVSNTPRFEDFKKSVAEVIGRADIAPETKAEVVAQAFLQSPRATVHGADELIGFLEKLVSQDGESFREQLPRLAIANKAYPHLGSTQKATIELTEYERKYLEARLNDKSHKLGVIPVLTGKFIAGLIDELALEIKPEG